MSEKINNNVVYFTRMHWIIFFWPVLALGVALTVYFYVRELGLVLVLFACIWILMNWATYYFSSLTIKRNQIILRSGVLVRETLDIPLSKIEAVDIRQSILGSVLRYGMIRITGTGGTRRTLNYLNNPLTCRRHIEHLMANSQTSQ